MPPEPTISEVRTQRLNGILDVLHPLLQHVLASQEALRPRLPIRTVAHLQDIPIAQVDERRALLLGMIRDQRAAIVNEWVPKRLLVDEVATQAAGQAVSDLVLPSLLDMVPNFGLRRSTNTS